MCYFYLFKWVSSDIQRIKNNGYLKRIETNK
jgi:hypothetical protein